QNAGNTRGGKCFRRVHFILDEFGNMPAIESMDNIVTVCLGRNILFDLFLQSYAQLGSVYGDYTAKIIKENCQNHLYIMSQDKDTHEEISKRVGEKTVEKHSTSEQDPLSLDTSKQTNVGSQRIITPYKLSTLMMGEMVVLRLHRENKKRQKIRSYSIFSTKETSMPFRFEYLGEYFDPNRPIEDFNIPSEHKTFDLAANAIDVDDLISESINRSLLLSLEEGLQPEEELLQIDEETFRSVLKRFDAKDVERYREIIKLSIVEDLVNSEKINLIDFLKQAVTEDLKPLFKEEERCAFLQLANFYLNDSYYKDISNLVRLDTE
ncbi:TraG/TraD/VirD4 family protein, partial [Enterococcus casseliflavus]|uniref:TraG/TraD/VirD4 family protein n=1 Tax=Enterococcus casseliflavus TaxID=37734 RepID=UPI003D6A6863